MSDLWDLKRKIDILWKIADICPQCETNPNVVTSTGYGKYCPVCDVRKTPTPTPPKSVEDPYIDVGHIEESLLLKNNTFSNDIMKNYNLFVAGINSDLTQPYGKEHYRLLSYLSTKFENQHLIDIGTHTGYSAYVLSYNPANIVDTFDIVDKGIAPEIKNRKNIVYHYQDLFVHETRQPMSQLLLESPMIFLDVDPHNGIMEIGFYNYLFENHYKGLLVCDDIHYFEDMRNNFWSKIPDQYKLDATKYGHWSGTGLIHFDGQSVLNKYLEDIVKASMN